VNTLLLLRHAKSGGADLGVRDVDRPLNDKGRRAAETMGRHLRDLDLGFDAVIASPAVRVVQTLEAVAAGYGGSLAPVWDRRMYLASAAMLLDVAHEQTAQRVLLVGHNPGLEELVLALAPAVGDLHGAVAEKYPTASFAELQLAGDWAALAPGTATLTRFIRPRDLDPTLGPDTD
jgi:phosphohistidine phosphatase